MVKNFKKSKCLDCGSTPVNHFSAKTTIILGFLIKIIAWPLAKLEDWLAGLVLPKMELLLPFLFKILSSVRLGRITDKLEADNIARTKYMWEAGKARGIKIHQFRILNRPTIIFWADYKGERVLFEGLPRPNGANKGALEWMDNKAEMKKKFLAGGIPVARGGVAMTRKGALKIFNSIRKPVITKPHLGSRSRHTTIHINTKAEFLRAFKVI